MAEKSKDCSNFIGSFGGGGTYTLRFIFDGDDSLFGSLSKSIKKRVMLIFYLKKVNQHLILKKNQNYNLIIKRNALYKYTTSNTKS